MVNAKIPSTLSWMVGIDLFYFIMIARGDQTTIIIDIEICKFK